MTQVNIVTTVSHHYTLWQLWWTDGCDSSTCRMYSTSMTSVTAVTIVATFRILFDQTVSLVLVWVWRGKEAEQVARVRKWTGPHLYRGEDENLFFFFAASIKWNLKEAGRGSKCILETFFDFSPSLLKKTIINAMLFNIHSRFCLLFLSFLFQVIN